MEKITLFNGKTHYKWPFSIATLNYQRVTIQDPKEKKKTARLNALESRIKGPGLGPQLWQPIDPYELWSILGIMNH